MLLFFNVSVLVCHVQILEHEGEQMMAKFLFLGELSLLLSLEGHVVMQCQMKSVRGSINLLFYSVFYYIPTVFHSFLIYGLFLLYLHLDHSSFVFSN